MNKITIKKSLTFLLILSILSVFNLSVFAETVEEVNAKAAVEIAQQTEFQSDYDYAENLVDNLPNVTTNSFDNSSLIEIPDTNTPSIVVDSTWEVVNENNCGQYLNDYIETLIDQGKTKFYIEDGNYELDHHLMIDVEGVKIKGESKENTIITQTSSSDDSIYISADNCLVADLTVDNDTYTAKSAIVGSDCNNATVYNCILFGQDDCFTLFFAGPDTSAGSETLNAFDNNELNSGNKILNCTINSEFFGDGLSFSLQKDGIVKNNILNGTKIAFYMCRDSFVVDNTINYSVSHGIYYSIPANDNVIANNTINNCEDAAIKVGRELEHGTGFDARGLNLQLVDNTITDSNYFGMEIDLLKDSIFYNNNVENTKYVGIYLLRSENLQVIENTISNPSFDADDGVVEGWSDSLVGGIFADYHIQDSIFDKNVFENTLNNCRFAIKIFNNNENADNTVINNLINGDFTNDYELNGSELEFSIKADLENKLSEINPVTITNSKNNDNLARTISNKTLVCVTDHFGNALNAMTDGTTSGGICADSWNGQQKTEDYWGIEFNGNFGFNEVVYTAGSVGSSGGWFENNLRVQVNQNGSWVDVNNSSFDIAYPYDITAGPDISYTISFDTTWGSGIRVIGSPVHIEGRNDAFTSIEEFEIYYK